MQVNTKKIAAEKAVEFINDGMVVGLGTGSTAYWAIQKIGERIKEGLKIKAVASSVQTETMAKDLNIPIIPFSELEQIDITIDGADEVDKDKNLIKGGGGALLREKILAANSEKFIVVVDETKLVDTLGKFPLPVEIVPFASNLTIRMLQLLGCKATLRKVNDVNYITDNGNLIVDCLFTQIKHPEVSNTNIHLIPGVVETGLFVENMVNMVLVGTGNGDVKKV